MSVARFEDYLPVVIGLTIIMVWSVIFLLLPYCRHLRLDRELKQQEIQRVIHRPHLGRWLSAWRSERTYHLGKTPSPDLEEKLTAQLQRQETLRIEHPVTGRIVLYNDRIKGDVNNIQAMDFSNAVIEIRIRQVNPEVHCLAIFDAVAHKVGLITLAFGIPALLLILVVPGYEPWRDLRIFYSVYLVVVLGCIWFIRVVAQFLATGNFFDALLIEALTAASVDSTTPGPL